MKRYRLIRDYPNSPKLNSTVLSTESEFYSIKPDKYPEFWEEFESEKTFISEDGFTVFDCDSIWTIDDKFKLQHRTFTPEYFNYDLTYWKVRENAEKYLESLIEFPIENEIIKGENVILHPVLAHGDWNLGETTTSFKQFVKSKTKSNPGSNKWKFFRTEKERDDYIHDHKPIYSRVNVGNMFAKWRKGDFKDLVK